VRPFAIHLEDGFETKGPPDWRSPQFKTDFDEVKLLGARQSTAPHCRSNGSRRFLDGSDRRTMVRSSKSGGQRAQGKHARELTPFALLSVPLRIRKIACFHDKYVRPLHWRPITRDPRRR